MLRFAIVAGLVSCGGPAVPPSPPPGSPGPPGPSPCDQAGTAVARVLHLDGDRATAIAAIVEHHCRVDAWPAVATACVAAAADHDAALQCAYQHLTEQQHDLVVRDMRPLLPAPPDAPPDESSPSQAAPETQAQIAEREELEGVRLRGDGDFAGASEKFRDAAARVPQPQYLFHLCDSLYHEGKYGEALTACEAADRTANPRLHAEIAAFETRIVDAAKAQGLTLRH